MRGLLGGISTVVGVIVFGGTTAWGAAFLVDSTADDVDANLGDNLCQTASNTCTLRAAVQQANATTSSVDTIILTGGSTYTLTITGSGEDAAATGDLDITEAVIIDRLGAGPAIIDATGLGDRVFHVIGSAGDPDGAEFKNVTIQHGSATDANGGGILIDPGATATLNPANVTSNMVTGTTSAGGGVAVGSESAGATLVVSPGSSVSSNSAGNRGGGIWVGLGGVANVTESSVSGNAAQDGGGIFTRTGAVATITRSVLDNNTTSVGSGGGINNDVCGTTNVVNSTLSANTAAAYGGGIYNSINFFCNTILNLASTTIAFNASGMVGTGDGGGVYNAQNGFFAGTVNLKNTLMSGNVDVTGGEAPDCGGRQLNSQGYNLIGDTTGCTVAGTTTGNQLNKNPNLLPLANYGGLTRTHAITGSTATSFAYNKGNPGGCTDHLGNTLTVDQRGTGFVRVVGGQCDIGAYEAPVCGNGVVTAPEQCDDGNTIDGDLCDSACFNESTDTDHNEPEAAGATNGEIVTAYGDCLTPNQTTLAPPSFVTFACDPVRTDTVCAFNDGTAGTIKGTYKIAPVAAGNDVNVEVHLDGLQTSGCNTKVLGVFVSFNETGHVCEQDDDGYSACTRKTAQTTDILVGTATVTTSSGNTHFDLNVNMNTSTGIQRYRKNRDVGLEIRGLKVKRCTTGSCTSATDFGVTSFVPGILLP